MAFPSGTTEMQEALARFIKPESITPWLDRKIPAFDGLTPRQYVEANGLEALLAELERVFHYDATQ